MASNCWTPVNNVKKIGRRVARLLCDGTDLRKGGEMKGKQDSGVSKPVTSHANAETR
jgi:hypothetical protein